MVLRADDRRRFLAGRRCLNRSLLRQPFSCSPPSPKAAMQTLSPATPQTFRRAKLPLSIRGIRSCGRANYYDYDLRERASPRPALTKLPQVRRLRSLPFMASTRPKRSAFEAHVASSTIATIRKVADSSTSRPIKSTFGFTGCGRNASKKSSVLGLDSEMRNPRK